MNALKEASINTLKKMPDSCTVEDIMYEINFLAQVYEGLKDSEAGNVISTEALLEQVKSWRK